MHARTRTTQTRTQARTSAARAGAMHGSIPITSSARRVQAREAVPSSPPDALAVYPTPSPPSRHDSCSVRARARGNVTPRTHARTHAHTHAHACARSDARNRANSAARIASLDRGAPLSDTASRLSAATTATAPSLGGPARLQSNQSPHSASAAHPPPPSHRPHRRRTVRPRAPEGRRGRAAAILDGSILLPCAEDGRQP
jgi:hypothetical protein